MSQLSGRVLLAAAVVTSPAWWSTLVDQGMSLEVTVTRFLIAVGIAWVAFSIADEFIWPSEPVRVPVESDAQPSTPPTDQPDQPAH